MLSRIAESLFWTGRYLERAEDTARVLDAHLHQMLEASPVDETTACRALLEVMEVKVPDDVQPDAELVTHVLAFDDTEPSSITSSIRAARDAARSAREAISSEMWECLNSTYNGLREQRRMAEAVGPSGFFRYVRTQGAALAGLADSSMSRDDGWRFLVLGRAIERVDMTARLLTVRYASNTSSADWVTTLRCSSAHEAYLRTYRRAVDGSLVIEFLLLDRLFPRSVMHSLTLAERILVELDLDAGQVGGSEVRRLLGRARTELEYREVGELLGDLSGHLERLQELVAAASEAIGRRFFRPEETETWHTALTGAS